MKGFFPAGMLDVKTPTPLVPQCGACGLYKHCKSPKMEVGGEGQRGILVCGESPGATEDSQGEPFVGKAGRYQTQAFEEVGIDFRRDCWITNSLTCFPGTKGKEKKYVKGVGYCRPNLINAIKRLKPHTVILLGKVAVRSLIGWIWKEEVGSMDRWLGWNVPCQQINAWVAPTWHPSFMVRGENDKENQVRRLLFLKHLKRAVSHEKPPWKEVPEWQKQVKVVLDPAEAADAIQTMIQGNLPVAFDYETNMKKPDSKLAQIRCCSVSDGTTTVAYPWHGKAIEATKELLLSDVPKVGSNIKFEERWTRRILGVRVRNWNWDTMLAAHVLDNRAGITGVKFQAFALLGQGGWDDHVKQYLKSKKDGSNEVNRIKECDLHRLLTYCGMDSLMELLVARKQKKMMKWED